MHEMSLATSILGIVETAARQDAFECVRTLHLSVPALAGVDVGSLRFALEAMAPHTLLAGAELIIDEPASRARCLVCASDIEVEEYDVACPLCGGFSWQVSDDRGIRVVDLLVE